jgi:hypothetical protein
MMVIPGHDLGTQMHWGLAAGQGGNDAPRQLHIAPMSDANRIARPNGISVVRSRHPVGEQRIEHLPDVLQARTEVPRARTNDRDTR